MDRPELLVPAGDMDKLRVALLYGADAVYVGGERFGLRASAGNFSLEDLKTAVEEVHLHGKRLFLTLNAYVRPREFEELQHYLVSLRPLAIDAYIVSDPGVFSYIRQHEPEREIHLSTQANTINGAACQFWCQQGIQRINLARELNLAEITTIRAQTDVELEVFVHGAMCIAYSGRCLLSTALTGRSANEGACAQPCRWNYSLIEETRPAQQFPIEEDRHGTYIMNSRDLCLLEQLPQLISSGVNSLKIEGRMKTLYYVAAVTRVYRAAIDSYLADPQNYSCDPLWSAELDKVSHRPYTTDFLPPDSAAVHAEDSSYRRTHDFIAIVREVRSSEGVSDVGDAAVMARVEGRNRFFVGDNIELIGPAMRQVEFCAPSCMDENAQLVEVVQPNAQVWMLLPAGVQVGDMLRRQKPDKG
jgi:putative protease